MSDLMTFPDSVEEFMNQYKVVDTEQVYTNGAELVPIFRMRQWFEHLPSAQLDDLISRKAAIDAIESHMRSAEEPYYLQDVDRIMNYAFEIAASCIYNLPSAQRTGRWIDHRDYPGLAYLCSECNYFTTVKSYYCPNCGADMRGEQDE